MQVPRSVRAIPTLGMTCLSVATSRLVRKRKTRSSLGVGLAAVLLAGLSWGQVTERVIVSSGGGPGNFGGELSHPDRVVSSDGRYVAFLSPSTNLVPGDTNATWDVFLRDRLGGRTERVSVASGGAQANGFSGLYGISISSDGRYVAFESRASNLVPGDTNGANDVFLRDRLSGTTERVCVATSGSQADSGSWVPSISADGRFVAFTSLASNLVPGDTNGAVDVFIHDRGVGTTERVSVASGGAEGDAYSDIPSISRDGRFIAFHSIATNLVPGDTNGFLDVFVHDRQSGTTELVSVVTGGVQGNGHSSWASISGDGRFVAFVSAATNLVAGDTNAAWDAFVHDRRTGTTERVSVPTGGGQANGGSSEPSICSDGRYVAFVSWAPNLVPGGTNYADIYVRDRLSGTTGLASISTGGSWPDSNCRSPSIDESGRYVAFGSDATNLVPGDTNSRPDVFLHDRHATGFESLCDPGVDDVAACPCSNPPSGPGRGCDNSSGTGGASLSASGIAYLSIDSLVFTTSGEKPMARSLLLQGDAHVASGIVYGQGVLCAAGSLRRLFVKSAFAGSITAPDFGAGDPSISTRSAALGDPIRPGQSRWYFVYYRDPTAPGGCPTNGTFNSTQTGQVSWWP